MSQNLQEPTNSNEKLHGDGGYGSIGAAELLCSNCGALNPTRARFCTKCGQPLHTIGQMGIMQYQEGSSFAPYNASVGLNAEASTAPLLPSVDTEKASPPNGKQERRTTLPLVSSPDKGGAIPIIRNWSGNNNQSGWRPRIRSRRSIIIALIALLLLLFASSLPFLLPYLHTILPASTATVTITPASKNLSNNYAISAVMGTPNASQHQVGARLLSRTAPSKSTTVKATGAGHQNATSATGSLTFSGATGTETIPAGTTISGASGVKVYFLTNASISPNNTTTISAQAVNPGSAGNIFAYDINGSYYYQGNSNILVYVQNTSAFTGGQDAYDYTFVQQSDIDNAANGLVAQLTSNAQTAVQNQIRANERLVNAIQCNPKVTSNHQANDRATDVTVTASVTCQGEVYDLQAAQAVATDLLKSDAASQLGASYTLIGNVVTGMPTIVSTNQGGTVSMTVSAQGVWVFQVSDAQKQLLVQAIAGKTQADTTALLLKQKGIHKVSIATSGGLGNALPSANDIKFVVLNVTTPG